MSWRGERIGCPGCCAVNPDCSDFTLLAPSLYPLNVTLKQQREQAVIPIPSLYPANPVVLQSRGGRGGAVGGARVVVGAAAGTSKKREAILDLSKYVGQRMRVSFTGGRVVVGTLKGYDGLLNLVMDDLVEEATVDQAERQLGLAVLRGTSLVVLSPVDGSVATPLPAPPRINPDPLSSSHKLGRNPKPFPATRVTQPANPTRAAFYKK